MKKISNSLKSKIIEETDEKIISVNSPGADNYESGVITYYLIKKYEERNIVFYNSWISDFLYKNINSKEIFFLEAKAKLKSDIYFDWDVSFHKTNKWFIDEILTQNKVIDITNLNEKSKTKLLDINSNKLKNFKINKTSLYNKEFIPKYKKQISEIFSPDEYKIDMFIKSDYIKVKGCEIRFDSLEKFHEFMSLESDNINIHKKHYKNDSFISNVMEDLEENIKVTNHSNLNLKSKLLKIIRERLEQEGINLDKSNTINVFENITKYFQNQSYYDYQDLSDNLKNITVENFKKELLKSIDNKKNHFNLSIIIEKYINLIKEHKVIVKKISATYNISEENLYELVFEYNLENESLIQELNVVNFQSIPFNPFYSLDFFVNEEKSDAFYKQFKKYRIDSSYDEHIDYLEEVKLKINKLTKGKVNIINLVIKDLLGANNAN